MAEYVLKYKRPAKNNGEAIPLANGRIGAMVYGNPVDEIVKMNLDGFWSGKPCYRVNYNSKKAVSEIRKLIDDGETAKADKTISEKMQATPAYTRKFMPLLDLHIKNYFKGKPKNYFSWLDTSTSISAIEFDVGESHFKRTAFCSGDEGFVMGFYSNDENGISFDAWLDGKEEFCTGNRQYRMNTIIYTGGIGGAVGINFAAALGVRVNGGKVDIVGNKICVRDADFVMLVFNARTDIGTEEFDEHQEMVIEDIENAMSATYDSILEAQVEWYKDIFNRVNFNLESNSIENLDNLATDERILRLKGDVLNNKECTRLIHDNKMIELYFNFSRYLMITAGTFTNPLNIKGIWNDNPDSVGRYILSGNTQMCYWCADMLNMNECTRQLFSLIENICSTGEETAKNMYNIKHGAVAHTATDIFGDTMPNGTDPEAFFVMGFAWLVIHIYEHYEYTLDKKFLICNYKNMKRAAEFFINYLVEDEQGRLIVNPTVIPTVEYINEKGIKAKLGKGSSFDAQVLRVLFTYLINALEITDNDKRLVEALKDIIRKLPEIEVGKYGQIKEWVNDYEIVASDDNILYQLFGLHPADLITPSKTPKLADAARTTLVRRLIHGGLDKGWGCAWTANMWARLYDGDMVYENIKNILTRSTSANLINMYPEFSVDVNFGILSAITESLMQCTNGEIVILPALPKEWQKGYIKGLQAKGGFELNIEWENGKLKSAVIFSKNGRECRLRFLNATAISIISDDENIDSRIENGVVIFSTKENTTYIVRC